MSRVRVGEERRASIENINYLFCLIPARRVYAAEPVTDLAFFDPPPPTPSYTVSLTMRKSWKKGYTQFHTKFEHFFFYSHTQTPSGLAWKKQVVVGVCERREEIFFFLIEVLTTKFDCVLVCE